MSKNLVKYVALAACGYILIYVGVHLFDDQSGVALPMMATLTAAGTLLANHRMGPWMCVAAGCLAAIFGAITVVTHIEAPDLIFSLTYVAAALVAVVAGSLLMRRAASVGDGPTT